ncbi:MAG: hypothetical protein ACU837_12090 [Gammaproteobacteria bacterium]
MEFFKPVLVLCIVAFGLKHSARILKRISILQRIRRHLYDAPVFAYDLVDCYVRFQGRVETPNGHRSPLFQRACVFYQAKIFAEWRTKLKKPQRGTTLNRKTLYTDQPPLPFITLISEQGSVLLDLAAFMRRGNVLGWITEKSQASRCPEICADKASAKYRTYIVREDRISAGDTVLIYGKLRQDRNGQLMLTAPGVAEYPGVLLAGMTHAQRPRRNLPAELGSKLFRAKLALFFYGLLTTGVLIWFAYFRT